MPLQLSPVERGLAWAVLGGLAYLRWREEFQGLAAAAAGAGQGLSAREMLEQEVLAREELAAEVAPDSRVTQSRHLNTRAERPDLIIPPRVGRYDDPTVEEHVIAQFGESPRGGRLPGQFGYARFRAATKTPATMRSTGRGSVELALV